MKRNLLKQLKIKVLNEIFSLSIAIILSVIVDGSLPFY